MEEIDFICPHCGENQSGLVDMSAGNQQYIEDCQVCCCPIVFTIEIGAAGDITQIITRRENE